MHPNDDFMLSHSAKDQVQTGNKKMGAALSLSRINQAARLNQAVPMHHRL